MSIRTEKQRQTSRTNGATSSGPSTPEGKAVSSKNATQYGICVSDATFYDDPETTRQLTQLRTEYFDFYLPRSPVERDCIEEVVLCRARLARLQRIEEGLFIEGRERAFATDTITGPDGKLIYRYELSQYPPEERSAVANMHVAAAWRPVHDVFESLSRQETRLSNRLRRAERRFDELFSGRNNEPESVPEPEKVEQKNEPEPAPTPVAATPVPTPSQAPEQPPASPVFPNPGRPVSDLQPAPGKEAA